MSDTNELLDDMIEMLGKGWCKGSLQDDSGNHCMIGAAVTVATMQKIGAEKYTDTLHRIVQKADLLFPDRAHPSGDPGFDIPGFNDHEMTTLEDVLLVLKHAKEEE